MRSGVLIASGLAAYLGLLWGDGISRGAMVASPVARFITSRGVTVLVDQRAGASGVAIAAVVHTVGAEENASPGVGALVAGALFGSNSNLSREGVARAVYFAGGGLQTSWTPECLTVTCVATPETFSQAVWIIAQGLKSAEMDTEQATQALREQRAEQQREAADPVTVGARVVRAGLFPGHVYGKSPLNPPGSPRSISRQSLLAYYAKAFVPSNTVVAVCGNLDVAYVRRVMENNFVDYERPQSVSRRLQLPHDPPELTGPSRLAVHTASSTAAVVAGFRTAGLTDPAYPATRVLAALIGIGKGSRLFRAVRDRRGIGYRVGAELHAFARAGVLYAYAEVDASRATPSLLAELETLVVKAAESVISDQPSEEEVLRARRLAAGLHRQARQRGVERALGLATAELLAGGWEADAGLADRLERVAGDEVLRTAREVFPNRCVAVVTPELPAAR